ncbi:hypothetical protein Calag_1523 [Caldisphaera lagunensis DSM 15908]|uniref:DUF3834 domain-containing protein n=2 Tax=Caldisphaera lagunensis TaxID=200415 RepID=L0ABE9_CALLD|nr:hypothetical protein Calag_1523 [Caldisphaera lagunensis DSM 15908]
MINMEKIMVAPGPVSYPLILSEDKSNISLIFDKEGIADAVADSITSLIKRGLNVDFITVKELLTIHPDLRGPKIGVFRKGSAGEILLKALMDKQNIKGEIVYSDNMQDLLHMLNLGEINSAVISIAMVKPKETLESIVGAPGACGISINKNESIKTVKEAYELGISIAKKNPEESADKIVSRLPITVSKDFVYKIITRAEYFFKPAGNINSFVELVKKYI